MTCCPIHSASAKPFPSNIPSDLSRPSTNHSSNGNSNTSQTRLIHSLIDFIAWKFFPMSHLKCFCAKFEPIAWLPILALLWTPIPLPCMVVPLACRPGMTLGRVSILFSVASSVLDWASVVFLRHDPTTITCAERMWVGWWVTRAWSTKHGAAQLKISLISLKTK